MRALFCACVLFVWGHPQPFLRACDIPPLALIQADAHGDVPCDGDADAEAHLAAACMQPSAAAGSGSSAPSPQLLPDVTRAMLAACPPLMNVARGAAFHATAAQGLPPRGSGSSSGGDHSAAEAALVDALRTVLHV